MQTSFTLAQLADPATAEAERILRTCVHCGFCTATCPTYVLLGDELDSPRGRIYLIKDMLEHDRAATPEVVKHIDRCLSCLSCMTTCPSGVDYRRLVDHARMHIERTYRRPLRERVVRALLARIMPDPRLFRWALAAGALARPLAPLFERLGLQTVAAMLRLARTRPVSRRQGARRIFPAQGEKRGRVALLTGCVASVLAPEINAAAIGVLTRHGFEVVLPAGEGCCGSLSHHLGRERDALAYARRNVDAWMAEIDGDGLDAILTTASGCGAVMKDYAFMLRGDPGYCDTAATTSRLVRDICEFFSGFNSLQTSAAPPLAVADHVPCSLQHAQKVTRESKQLLARLGFVTKDVREGHLCCGAGGIYNLLQPRLANRLRERKIANIQISAPDVIAAANIGCMMHIAAGTKTPVVHPIELVDWATGGEMPRAMMERGS